MNESSRSRPPEAALAPDDDRHEALTLRPLLSATPGALSSRPAGSRVLLGDKAPPASTRRRSAFFRGRATLSSHSAARRRGEYDQSSPSWR